MMAARPRIRKRAHFPPNLHEPRPGYYVYRDPRDKKVYALGRIPIEQAIYEAVEANAKVAAGKETKSLSDRISTSDATVEDLLTKMPVSATKGTAKLNRQLDRIIATKFGSILCSDLKTKHIADMLEAKKAEGKIALARQLRARAVAVCRRGTSLGLMEHNPAMNTESIKMVVRRGRLTFEQFMEIYKVAPKVNEWLQRAMMLALISGQDRSTCANWPRRCVHGDFARVHRQKTGVEIEIPVALRMDVVGKSLMDVIRECRSTGVVSPYLIHHVRQKGKTMKGDRVTADALSAAFLKARKLAEIPDEGAPTFHEIRSLSKRLYEKQGNVDTKALLGHLSDQSARIYADPRGIEPIRVKVL
jgi:integrase